MRVEATVEHRTAPLLSLLVAIAVVLPLALAQPAAANCKGICKTGGEVIFDTGSKAGETLTTQYTTYFGESGVTFGTVSSLGFPEGQSCTNGPSGPPTIVENATVAEPGHKLVALTPNNASPALRIRPRSLAEPIGGCPDTGSSGAMFSCTVACTHLDVTVGQPDGGAYPAKSSTATFYSASGEVLDTQTVSFSQSGASNHLTYKGVGDVTFVAISSPNLLPIAIGSVAFEYDTAASPFFTVGLPSGGQTVRQGATLNLPIQLNRFNGESGGVAVKVSGLPAGVSAQVNPNPVAGGGATLELTAEPTAAPTGAGPPATVSVVGEDSKSTASGKLSLSVGANYELEEAPGGTWALPACTAVTKPIGIALAAGFTGTVSLSAVYHNAEEAYANAPTISVSPSTIVADGTGGVKPFSITINQNDWKAEYGAYIEITATSGALSQTRRYQPRLEEGPEGIFSFSPGAATPPDLGRPGTTVKLIGAGICPGERIAFGNVAEPVTPTSVVPDGSGRQVVTANVPPLATTGPIYDLHKATTDVRFQSATSILIGNYRQMWSYPFANYKASRGIFTHDLEELFGSEHVVMTYFDPCALATLGITSCPVRGPNPDAIAFLASYAGEGLKGNCYGISLSTTEFQQGFSLSPYPPPGATRPFALQSASGPSEALGQRIRLAQLSQESYQLLMSRLAAKSVSRELGSAGVHAAVLSQLAAGKPPIVTIFYGGSGHALVVHDVHDIYGGAYQLRVYDPNQPWSEGELSKDGAAHAAAEDESTIDVAADGSWTFRNLGWSGNVSDGSLSILTFDQTSLASYKMPSILEQAGYRIEVGVLGDARLAQVTDASGRVALAPNGASATGAGAIPGAQSLAPTDEHYGENPKVFLPAGTPFTAVVQPTGTGPATFGLRGSGFSANVTLAASAAGAHGAAAAAAGEQIAGNQTAHSVTVGSLPAGRGFSASVVTSPGGGSFATATLGGAGVGAGSSDSLMLSGGTASVAHSGPAATLALALGYAAPGGEPRSVQFAAVRLGPGERLAVRPSSWARLGAGAVTATITGPRGARRIQLRGRSPRANLLGGLRTDVRRLPGRRLRIRAAVSMRRPADGLQLAIVLHRGRRLLVSLPLARGALPAGGGAVAWTTPQLPAGRVTIDVVAAATGGPAGAAQVPTVSVVHRALEARF